MIGFSSKKSKLNKLIAWITLGIFSLQPALVGAQAVADTSAAANNRPTVSSAKNGTTVVQITSPSAAGVSRNLYRQFDIDSKGLILNNSFALTNTQLAGYIQGNSNLANGSARIILNEVTSKNISNLGGYLEVAGQRADVIIANRNGIVGNGFGFINTSRGVLTTGMPVFGGSGSLDAFRVTGGNISVKGKGIDANQTDRVDLISRAVNVNAGIWAKELNVVTGSNNVANNTLSTQAIYGGKKKAQVALDVSALGGMYADKIKLVGTEHGVGVNSQGVLSAKKYDLILTNDGKITLGGKVNASGNISINSTDDINSMGTVIAGSTIKVDGEAVNNTGKLTANSLTINAEEIANTGNSAMMAGTKDITLNALNSIENKDGATINSKGSITIAGSDKRNNGQPIDKAKSVLNQSATIKADVDITIHADEITNKRRIFEVGKTISNSSNSSLKNETTLFIAKPSDYTNTLVSNDDADEETWLAGKTVEELKVIKDSPEGNISAGRNMYLQANIINNDKSKILAAGTLNASGAINNTSQELYRTTTSYLQSGKVTQLNDLPLGVLIKRSFGKILYNFDVRKMADPFFHSDITVEQTSNVTSLFGGGQQVIIQAPSVNNITKDSVNVAKTELGTSNPGSMNQSGAIITAKNVKITTKQDIVNQNSKIAGDIVTLVAGRDIKNETTTNIVKTRANSKYGSSEKTIAGQTAEISATGNVTIAAGRDLQVVGGQLSAGKYITIASGKDVQIAGGQLSAGKNISIGTGRNLNIGTVTTNEKTIVKNYLNDITTNITSSIQADGQITMASQKDANLSSAQVEAGHDLTIKSTSGNISINTVSDKETVSERKGSKRNWTQNSLYDETIIDSSMQAGGNINITAVNHQNSNTNNSTGTNGGNINIESGDIYSETGAITINADKDVTIQDAAEQHESVVRTHKKKKRIFSSKTTDKVAYTLTNEVEGSSISGDLVDINSGKDLTIKGSNIVGTNDVTLHADNDVNLTVAKETGDEEHYQRVKKSGIFGGGGFLGFTIGKQSKTTKLDEQVKAEIGNAIGSVTSNVNITAGNKVKSEGTLITSGKNTNITGKDVTIDNSIDTYDSQYKYEFKQSGLSISLGGGIVDVGSSLSSNIEKADDVKDKRLKALYGYKAKKDLDTLKNLNKDLKGKLDNGLNVNISIGSSKTTVEQNTHVETVNMSSLTAGGNVSIKAINGDVNLDATSINATNVHLAAKKNLNIGSAQNIEQTNTNTKSSSASAGVSVSLSGTVTGASISGSSSKEKENETSNTYTESVIVASGNAILQSGKDTNILGSQVRGQKVVAAVGGNLNIASQQDTDNYTAKNQSGGLSIGIGNSASKGSGSTGKTNSEYRSVNEQAGIFTGQDGFDIYVGKNTDLKGAVIASDATPDKNKLSTGTLTYSDIQNKAEYEASSTGVSYSSEADAKNNVTKGVSPNIGVTSSDDAESTTKSAVSPGTIEVRSNPNQDLSKLSRDTENAANSLGKIFDKKTVQEQQELAELFSKEAFKLIGDLAQKQWEKAVDDAKKAPKGSEAYNEAMERVNLWDDGGAYKIALHGLAGGLTAQLGGGSFTSGAVGAGVNEAIQKELASRFKDNPDLHQWASYIVGSVATEIAGGNGQTGGSTAVSGTKYNWQNGHDKKYSPAIQSMLLQLTALYYAAEGDPEEQARVAQKADEIRVQLEENNFTKAIDTFASWTSSLAATNSIFGSSSRSERDAILAEVRQYEPDVDAGDNPNQDTLFFVAGFAVPMTKGSLLFNSGKAGEQYLAGTVGGVSQQYFMTSLGKRFIDQLADGVAYESKVGYVPLTEFVKKQVLKDAELLKSADSGVNAVEWNFFRSGITGKVGPSKQLIDFLDQHGIKYVIHD